MNSTNAFVIRKYPHGEADYIVELFTRDYGKLSAVAKNAKKSVKRFGGRLERFVLLKVGLNTRPRGMPVLEECLIQNVFGSLMDNLKLFSWGSFVLETLDVLTPYEDPDEGIFDLINHTLASLNGGQSPLKAILDFQLQILALSGYSPRREISPGSKEETIENIKFLIEFTQRYTERRYKSLSFLEELLL
ncbi:MAG: DNA repair protein RecO [Thermodesulfobacteriota bacterium]